MTRHGHHPRFVAALLTIGLIGAGIPACSDDTPERTGAATGPPVHVTVSEVVILPAAGQHPATVRAETEFAIATRMSGRIAEITVQVGDPVRPGDLLVALDDADIQSDVERARSAEVLARRTFERMDALARDGAAAQQELDEARARLEAAEAQLASATAQLDYALLRAPFSGVVTARHADPGDLASPGRPLLSLVGDGVRKVVAELPAALASGVAEGRAATVLDPETGQAFQVTVSRVVPALSPSSRTFRVEAPLPAEAALLHGAFVRLGLPGAGTASRWIPEDAIVRRGQLTGVFTVEDGHLRLRWIRLGAREGDAVEVLSGPAGPVVRGVDGRLVDGAPAEVVELEAWSPEFGDSVTPGVGADDVPRTTASSEEESR